MKKVFCIFGISIIFISLFIFVNIEKIFFQDIQEQNNLKTEKSDIVITKDGAPVLGSNILEDFSIMRNPIDSIIICMLENEKKYSISDNEFFWLCIYYFVNLYVDDSEFINIKYNKVEISKDKIEEYAQILFGNFNQLIDIPNKLSDFVEYNDENNTYIFKKNYERLSYTSIENVEKKHNKYIVIADLYIMGEENMIIDSKWHIEMIDNPYLNNFENSKYLYSILDVEKIEDIK